MKELVVISGKGGTGKTSLVAAFAALAGKAVLADCDVDAADLHLVLAPAIERTTPFYGGNLARIDPERCTGCGACVEHCRYGAISPRLAGERSRRTGEPHADKTPIDDTPALYEVDAFACEGCGVCVHVCPSGAVLFEESLNGEWYVSRTRFGPLVHARLRPGAENSGRLVSIVRSEAKRIAGERGIELLLIDGSPGIGCPVIASIAGADLVVAVTEPTRSGIHDLERVIELTRHFGAPAIVAVNKADINEDAAASIARYAAEEGVEFAGNIRYDPDVTRAQMEGKPLVEISDGLAAHDIAMIWRHVRRVLAGSPAAEEDA